MGRDRERRRGDSESDDEARERRRKQVKGRERSRDEDEEGEGERRRRRKRKEEERGSKKSRRREDSGDSEDGSSSGDERRRRKKDSSRRRSEKGSSRRKRRDRGSEDSAGSDSEDGEGGAQVTEEELREYLAKKAQRRAQKLAKKLRQKAVSGYTNDSNPFGDTNLTETFVWRKKIEKDVLTGTLDPRDVTLRKERERLESRQAEIEKVKKRREERLLEKARHEEEMALLARERARAEFQDWEAKEEEFHFEQSKVRSEIRLREGRAKPIDVLARNLDLSPDFDVEVNEPYTIFRGLTVGEMEELKEDIKLHLEYDKASPLNQEFWTALMVVCHHEIADATRRDILDRAKIRGEEPPPEVLAEERGLHSAVNSEVEAMLSSKDSRELAEMEERIQGQMESGEAKMVEYWESVLKRLKLYKAKARLREIHSELLRKHLALLQAAEGGNGGAHDGEAAAGDWDRDENGEGATWDAGPGSYSPELITEEEAAAEGGVIEDAMPAKAASQGGADAGAGGFSPELMHEYEGEDVEDPEADKAEQERKRASVMEQQHLRARGASPAAAVPAGAATSAAAGPAPGQGLDLTAEEKAAAVKMMGPADGDAVLGSGAEVALESQVYWWHDKYRPRKPRYFNRVHTGYEWNKYNQTHYDHDNPPPKIVQGYKFNIFYPDLLDRSKAPTYSIEPDGSGGETCLIRFHAGPPYEDIAFRVVNKEWEYSHKRGFKCTFDRGILHVYFNFKRYRYRR